MAWTPARPPKLPTPERPQPLGPGERVHVYDPRLADLLKPGGGSDRPIAPALAPGLVSFKSAWQAARRRANDAIASGAVPARYRQLVRDYFSGE